VKKPRPSALSEINGIDQPNAVNADLARKQVAARRVPSAGDLIPKILGGDITALSRAITLVESANPEHSKAASEVISACLPHSGHSVRIGITGVPGVGKSTFIEAFGKHLTSIGKKVAVLAVDPSSTLSHGSILGDKTRMEDLVRDKNAYIRPSASGETLGGVARKTRETITLCEAAGFDTIIIETVGVGQSETAVHGMVDFFLLLQIAGAGDELQGIKRGIMEMADAVVINKADGDNLKRANLAKTEFNRALHFFPPKPSGWMPKAMTCSAIEKSGIAEVWKMILDYLETATASGYLAEKRRTQNQSWMVEFINGQLTAHFYTDPNISALLETTKQQVSSNTISPFAAAELLLRTYFGNL
jgi:LAO/AO transport system kinase